MDRGWDASIAAINGRHRTEYYGTDRSQVRVAEEQHKALGQFILPYDAVRQASDPDALLLGSRQETYEGDEPRAVGTSAGAPTAKTKNRS